MKSRRKKTAAAGKSSFQMASQQAMPAEDEERRRKTASTSEPSRHFRAMAFNKLFRARRRANASASQVFIFDGLNKLAEDEERRRKKIAIATVRSSFRWRLFQQAIPAEDGADERRRANASASPVLIFNGLLNQRRRWDANNINY
jgi:hypothetical protein